MNKPNLSLMFRNVQSTLSKHSPEILTGIGIVGMVTTVCLAVRATPKALELIDAKKEEIDAEKLTPVEVVKTAWKPFIPVVVTGLTSGACFIGANSVHAKRHAVLATAYKLSEAALLEYREKVIETIGEKKEQVARDKVKQKQITEHCPVEVHEVYNTGKGNSLCLDPLSKRLFISDIEHIRRVENIINRRLLHDISGSASLNEFYDELGLERTDVGDILGWCTEHLVKLDIGSGITDKGEPCLVISHYNAPMYDF